LVEKCKRLLGEFAALLSSGVAVSSFFTPRASFT
jgi:hypothetical protein